MKEHPSSDTQVLVQASALLSALPRCTLRSSRSATVSAPRGADALAGHARERLSPILTGLADLEGDQAMMLRRAARAAAYLLTVSVQPRADGNEDLSEALLLKFSRHPDDVTARLSRWALSFRFAPDGKVRPLLAAADHGVDYDAPW